MSANAPQRMPGARALIRCLEAEGVDTIFGYPGGVVLPIYDELYDSSIRHILVRHEQAAAHAADGYARATGRVGVCLATSGPGATNLVTGIATAYMDSVPIVAMTGQVVTSLIGNDAFQEADITGITIPITKHNYLIKDAKELPRIVKEAFYIASTGRPGPVLIDIPKDVSAGLIDYTPVEKVQLPSYKPTYSGHPLQIKKACELIEKAERPVMLVGGGAIISGAHEEVRQLAETLMAPVTTTLMGKGAFPEDHPLSLGMLGMHGTRYANYAVIDCDLLIAIGARFDDRVTGKIESFAPRAKIIHIDIDPAELGKNVRVDVPIVGDARIILKKLISTLKIKLPKTAEWNRKVEAWKKEYPLDYDKDCNELKPQCIVERLNEIVKDGIFVTEVGQNQMWAAHYIKCKKPRTFISSGGLGTMGYGFPAAIGAKIGRPDSEVWDIAGDGSIQMNIQELATAVSNDVPVRVAILNNEYLGMVRQWQELFYNRRYSYTSMKGQPDFVKVAEAYGAVGIRVDRKEDVKDAIIAAMKSDKPVFIDFRVSKEENVFPMVPAGASINEFVEQRGYK
ncbi:acetolactate synthase, large subunit, biosynthetic type [Methanocella conradii HZ254]|uniref:Acetolactate synthase n=1 Tax=Methanocella conradii (strain DSM 24694 / JCM 17849 / CGMCC 1.5162 / HZ254) TaxID=1041930 RepID=H8I8C9_METCZ|nr:acetolactate synthase large subunit [Methanocella conradii]AFC98982.1 acetolactate synthase, large subunit, biosynthetic type [Methanocella conradii HZ254]MDI6896773.1 acetolactate synthase large subunit [Methanocella conradii]